MRPILINDNIISITAQRGIARYFNKIVAGATASFGQDAVICTPISRDYGPARHIRTVRFPGSWRIGLQDRMTSLAAWITRPSVMYGDPINPQGTQLAVRELVRVLAPGGNLFLATPVGRPRSPSTHTASIRRR